jgi:hypothetical protein
MYTSMVERKTEAIKELQAGWDTSEETTPIQNGETIVSCNILHL